MAKPAPDPVATVGMNHETGYFVTCPCGHTDEGYGNAAMAFDAMKLHQETHEPSDGASDEGGS